MIKYSFENFILYIYCYQAPCTKYSELLECTLPISKSSYTGLLSTTFLYGKVLQSGGCKTSKLECLRLWYESRACLILFSILFARARKFATKARAEHGVDLGNTAVGEIVRWWPLNPRQKCGLKAILSWKWKKWVIRSCTISIICPSWLITSSVPYISICSSSVSLCSFTVFS